MSNKGSDSEPFLFEPPISAAPLAERMRPKEFDDFVGQEHLTGTEGVLRKMLKGDHIRSMIFWGPPGTGRQRLPGSWLPK